MPAGQWSLHATDARGGHCFRVNHAVALHLLESAGPTRRPTTTSGSYSLGGAPADAARCAATLKRISKTFDHHGISRIRRTKQLETNGVIGRLPSTVVGLNAHIASRTRLRVDLVARIDIMRVDINWIDSLHFLESQHTIKQHHSGCRENVLTTRKGALTLANDQLPCTGDLTACANICGLRGAPHNRYCQQARHRNLHEFVRSRAPSGLSCNSRRAFHRAASVAMKTRLHWSPHPTLPANYSKDLALARSFLKAVVHCNKVAAVPRIGRPVNVSTTGT
jgi:hypothetical protein